MKVCGILYFRERVMNEGEKRSAPHSRASYREGRSFAIWQLGSSPHTSTPHLLAKAFANSTSRWPLAPLHHHSTNLPPRPSNDNLRHSNLPPKHPFQNRRDLSRSAQIFLEPRIHHILDFDSDTTVA